MLPAGIFSARVDFVRPFKKFFVKKRESQKLPEELRGKFQTRPKFPDHAVRNMTRFTG
jgi:hypothetical protein